MPKDSPLYLVEEAPIVSEHDRIIALNSDLKDHLALVNASLDCLSRLPVAHIEEGEDELMTLRLTVRCFNSGAAALRLVRSGYFQPALTMVRDLIEVYFLLDLFSRDPGTLSEWRTMDDKERNKNFKPVRVRERLDALDGHKEKRREQAYKMLSQHAAHVSPAGFSLISPEAMTQVGPFPDEGRLRAVMEELASHLGYATVIVCNLIISEDATVLKIKQVFLRVLEAWQRRYLPSGGKP